MNRNSMMQPQKPAVMIYIIQDLWHFIGKGPIWSKWRYCHWRVVWVVSKHLRPIPSTSVKNSLRNRPLNLKNEKSKNF